MARATRGGALALLALLAPALARAQPLPTPAPERSAPPAEAAPVVPDVPPAPSPSQTVEGPAPPARTEASVDPAASASSGAAAVPPHALVYKLEGIEIRGNVRTRDRVILRYVPFRPGSVLDVEDPEIELARFRLLGTGFFQAVSFTLKRGSQRGAVVLVVDVRERNPPPHLGTRA